MVEDEKAARRLLERKQRELELLLAMDQIRDTVLDPSAMLAAIVNTVAERLRADLCLLCLVDRESEELELRAVNEHRSLPYRSDSVTLRELARRAMQADAVVTWEGADVSWALGLPHPVEGLQLVSVPISVGEQCLGVILLARVSPPFDSDELELLRAAEGQVDSAVLQARTRYDLQQRNKELQTIYQIDRIRDQNLAFDEMLDAVLHVLTAAIQAEMGFVMLYQPVGQRLELRAVTHDDLFRVSPYYKVVDRVAYEALHRAALVCYNDLGEVIRSIMCLPLVFHDEIIGVLGVLNRYGPQGFDAEDRRLLTAIGSQMDTAIFESLERRRLRRLLGRSVDPQVLERLLRNPDVDFLKGERMELSVLYADLRGSTYLAEHTAPELLVGFVNDFLARMTEIILANGATLDKFMGDEVMALFGAPFPRPDHALQATRVGLEMQVAHRSLMEAWRGRGVPAPPLGVGIASGELIVGEMGCAQRADYTVIGKAANLGSRLCGAAEAGQVLVCQATYDQIKGAVEVVPVPGLRLKGVGHEITAYHVIRLL